MNFTEHNLQQIRTIVREEVRTEVRKEVRKEVRAAVQREVREQTADMRADIAYMKGELAYVKGELTRIGGLMEHLEEQFRAVAELISSSLGVKVRVDDHETRVGVLEADNRLTKRAVALHSRQLKALLPGAG